MTYALRALSAIGAAIVGGVLGYAVCALRARLAAQRARSTQTRNSMRIEVVCADITTVAVDAIVNAAKSSLLGGGGVDGAIHRAGGPAILRECRKLRAELPPQGLSAGLAVITTAGDLPAKWVIHTVGPVYDMFEDRSALLRSCYAESMAAADAVGAQSVAFPLISAGVYGWPKDDAVVQALTALKAARTDVQVAYLVIYDQETYQLALGITEGFTR